MRYLTRSLLLALLCASIAPAKMHAQETGATPNRQGTENRAPGTTAEDSAATKVPRLHHPWGRYEPGAWALIRAVTESIDEDGEVVGTSTTDTRTTLMAVGEESLEVEVAAIVEMIPGKRVPTDPVQTEQGFHGEDDPGDLKISELEPEAVVIEGREIPCRVLRFESSVPNGKTVTSVHYSPSVAPYILRRTSVTTNLETEATLRNARTRVIRLNMPSRALSKTVDSACVESVITFPKGRLISLTFTSTEVPGELVWRSTKELNAKGKLVRRSTFALSGYSATPQPDRVGFFSRYRSLWRSKLQVKRNLE